jgi:hypothetical protein
MNETVNTENQVQTPENESTRIENIVTTLVPDEKAQTELFYQIMDLHYNA